MRVLHGFIAWILCTLVLCDIRSQIEELTERAFQAVEREDQMYEARYYRGIDKKAVDFTKVESLMFEDTPSPAMEIEKHSRLINWVKHFIDDDNYSVTLQDVLSGQNTTSSRHVRCPYHPPATCQPSKYRTIDGTCNNRAKPLQGAAFVPFARDLNPVYEQAEENSNRKHDQPRQTGVAGALPNARTISTAIHQNASLARPAIDLSFFATAWGQFLAHDVTDRVVASGFNESKVKCCDQRLKSPSNECFNIPVPYGDRFRENQRFCIPLHRSMEATDVQCENGQRESLNAATSYIDGSAVYGSTEEKARFLRAFTKGLMATSVGNELPFKAHVNPVAEKQGFGFVQAGDPRAAEITPLMGIHTIWIREHNRVAKKLSLFNSGWSDNKLYNETRRIIIAMIQHITYQEWLPLIVGPDAIRNAAYTYDESVDATTTNVISTAAFRFGHTLISPSFSLYDKDYTPASSNALTLRDLFLRPTMYLLNEQNFMRGLLEDPSQPMDPFVTPDLVHKLMETYEFNGGDLIAMNIQRGREHGLPSYNAWRSSIGLSAASSFTTGPNGFQDIPEKTVQAFARVYSHPDDVDVWTGGVSENPVPSGTLGPLFATLLARQFERYRVGDRFWYETREDPQAFTHTQLTEIRKTTLARVICDNLEVETIQPQAFKLATVPGNQRKTCGDVPSAALFRW